MKQLFILLFILTQALAHAQSTPMAFEDWKTTAGTQNFFYKNVTKTDASNNVYVAGATLNSAGNTDILLAKYSPNGVQLWIRQYAGAGNGTDFAAGLVVTSTDVYVTGAVTTSTASPTTDAITMRYTSAGVFQWATTYNGTGNLHDAGKHVVLDASNNIYITGASYNASGNTDFLTIKYSPTGVQQWVSTYNYASNLDDAAIKIVASGANVTITGAVTSSPSNYKFATVKYTQATGAITNTDVSVAVTTASVDVVADLASDGAGNVYVVGSTFVTGQGTNYYVQKLSTTLVTAWTYTFNGASSLNDVAKGVQVDASGNVYITGYSTSSTQGRNIATIKLNSSGVQQWVQYYNDPSNKDDEAADLIVDASANVYITGYNTNTLNKTDYYTIKYNSSGIKQWDVITDGGATLNDNATNITLDSLNNVIITGQSETAPSTFNFLTVKYVQYDVTNPIDPLTENPNKNYLFYENKGQIINTLGNQVPQDKYYTLSNPKLYFENTTLTYVFSKVDTTASTLDTLARIDMKFISSSSTTKPYSYNQKTEYLNYFLPHCTSGATYVRGSERLLVPNIYPNIDLYYYSNQNGLKYYFVVKPGGNPKSIKFEYLGAVSSSITPSGWLKVNSGIGNIDLNLPKTYQISATGSIIPITAWNANYVNAGTNKYMFNIGTYTTSLSLVIEIDNGNAAAIITSSTLDNVKWTTYHGGSDEDYYKDGAYSTDNYYYTTGYTYSSSLPKAVGTELVGVFCDALITKFNFNGNEQWRTLFGGSYNEFGKGIAIDNADQPIVVGNSGSSNMPIYTPSGAYAHALTSGSNYDGIIMKFDNGGIPIWSTCMGGTYYEEFSKVAINSLNDIYVVGQSESTDFPYYPSASFNQSAALNLPGKNGAIVKFTNLYPVASTFIGTTPTIEKLNNIFINKSNNDVYIVGDGGYGVPITNPGSNAFMQNTLAGNYDGFILKYNSSNTRLWSTYFGGEKTDYLSTIGMSKEGHLYIAGSTSSINMHHKFYNTGVGYNDTIKTTYSTDPLIARFDTKDSLIWSTYYSLSGKLNDIADIALDTNNTLYVLGSSQFNSGFAMFPNPTLGGTFYDNVNNGATDGFIASFTKQGVNSWGTYFGGNYYDILNSITLGVNNRVYFCGSTESASSFPLADNNGYGTLYTTLNGTDDGNAGFFEIISSLVGIKENSLNNQLQFVLFPNPAQSELNVLFKDQIGNIGFEIYNTQGQLVNEGLIQNNKIEITNLSQGMYIVKLHHNKSIITSKFIKQ